MFFKNFKTWTGCFYKKRLSEKTKKQSRKVLLFFSIVLFWGLCGIPAFGDSNELSILSLDDLLDVEVTSVAKVPEKMTSTPAAIYILTKEDLRRSGADSIPEALRMVPGLHVYQIDANKWAISSRGFASRFANKMLVMIDGRTVYSPLFSGVFWDVQDLMLENIERIEVIRGPGSTLWGANAVNGVINIISKKPADTQGALVTLQGDDRQSGEVSARYGDWLNDHTAYRVYGKYFDRDSFENISGGNANDDWHQGRAGFRVDMNLAAAGKLTLQGDIYDGKSGQSIIYLSPLAPFINKAATDASVSGGNLLARWIRSFSENSEMILQVYYDRTERDEFFINETLDTADIDFQYRFTMTNSLELLWGLGYRYTKDDTSGKETIPGIYSYNLNPDMREDNLFSGFIQGRLPFGGGKGEATLGTKVEHNDYTGYEWQPNARVMWNFNDIHSAWGAFSRSVRTPFRVEHDADVNAGAFLLSPQQGGFLTFVRIMGNDKTEAEKVFSYELGYRVRPIERLFLDVTAFYNHYYDLVAGVPAGIPFLESTSTSTYMVMPIQVDNGIDGETYGLEINSNWSVKDWWRLTTGFTWFHYNTFNKGNSEEARQGFSEDENAEYLISLVSYMDLPKNFDLNAALYYVDSLSGLEIDSYIRFDLNVNWHPTENLTLSMGGRNLVDDSHQEFNDTMDGIIASEIPRTVYAKLSWSF